MVDRRVAGWAIAAMGARGEEDPQCWVRGRLQGAIHCLWGSAVTGGMFDKMNLGVCTQGSGGQPKAGTAAVPRASFLLRQHTGVFAPGCLELHSNLGGSALPTA